MSEQVYVVLGIVEYEYRNALVAFRNASDADVYIIKCEHMSDKEQIAEFDAVYDSFEVKVVELI